MEKGETAGRRTISRRNVIRSGFGLLSAVAGGKAVRSAFAREGVQETDEPVRLVMVIDLRRCYGCKACSVACKSENGVRLGGFRSWVSEKEAGNYPDVRRHFLPRLCNHCRNASCKKVCPTGATYRGEDGIIDIDKSRCIGCRHCMGACPYNARYFNPTGNSADERAFPSLTRGTVDKCDFCIHRTANGLVPACVNTCPAEARKFGNLNDPESDVSKLLAGEASWTLLPEFGTKPSVFYIGDGPKVFRRS